jgi:ATP-binding cassette, subfamily C, bacterial
MQSNAKDILTATIRRCGVGMGYALFLSFFLSLLQLTVPLYMLQVYDRVINSRSTDTLVMLSVVAVGALLVFAILEFIRTRVYQLMAESLSRRLNVAALRASIAEAVRNPGTQSAQALRDLNDLRLFVSGSAITVPLDAIWSPLFLVVLFLLHPVYGTIALVAGLILIALSIANEFLTRRPLAEANEAAARAMGEASSLVRNAEVIEAMGMIGAIAQRWRKSQSRVLDLLREGSTSAKALAATSKSIRLALQIGMLAAGVTLVIDRAASPGSMVAATIIMGRALMPFEQLIEGWRQWVFAIAAYRRIHTLLTGRNAPRQRLELPKPEGKLVVDRVSFIPPGQDKAVLKSVSFTLEPGEVLGIIGPSAAGKSTLARLLIGVQAPTAGGVFLDGHNVATWDRENLGRYVGYVPQNVSLLNGSVRDNIARMGEGEAIDVVAAARRADIHEMIGRLPFGYDTPIGETAHALSGGQRQRIALARALYNSPRLLILDEPNSNLDQTGERALRDAIVEAKKEGTTVVLIAHRPSIIQVVDKLLVLKDGAVEQFGPRTDIIKTVTPGETAPGARPAPSPRLVRS